MIAVGSQIKTDCNSDALIYKEYIVIDSQTVEIKGKMSNTAYKDSTFFGTFNLKMLEFTTQNDVEYKGKTFEYYKLINGNAFKIGSYITTAVVDNDSKENIKVTAMDYGLKFAIPYESELDYAGGEVTLQDVWNEIATTCGVTTTSTIINGDFIVDSNQFSNVYMCGDVISHIALLGGCFATINEDDELVEVFTNTTDEVIEEYVELDDKRDTLPITCVELGFKGVEGNPFRKDDDLIALYGENWLRIYDNPFAYSTEKQEELIDAIFNNIKGFGYSSFESKYSFKPYLQLGDLIQVRNKDGNLVDTIVLKIDTDYDNITLSAPSIVKAAVEYEVPESIETAVKKASIKVDQATGEITLLTSSVSSLEQDVADNTSAIETTQSQIILMEDSILAQVSTSLETKAEQGEVDVLKTDVANLQLTADALQLDITTINTDGVDKVTTSTGFTFNEDGLTIAKTGEEMSALVDNTGLYVNRNEDNVLTVNNEGVEAENITVRNFFKIGTKFRVEEYSTGIGFFFVGGDE
jgi:hypothetical protein